MITCKAEQSTAACRPKLLASILIGICSTTSKIIKSKASNCGQHLKTLLLLWMGQTNQTLKQRGSWEVRGQKEKAMYHGESEIGHCGDNEKSRFASSASWSSLTADCRTYSSRTALQSSNWRANGEVRQVGQAKDRCSGTCSTGSTSMLASRCCKRKITIESSTSKGIRNKTSHSLRKLQRDGKQHPTRFLFF